MGCLLLCRRWSRTHAGNRNAAQRAIRTGQATVPSRDRRLENVSSLFNSNRDDFAPRSATFLRGLLDDAAFPQPGDGAATARADAPLPRRGSSRPWADWLVR